MEAVWMCGIWQGDDFGMEWCWSMKSKQKWQQKLFAIIIERTVRGFVRYDNNNLRKINLPVG